MKRLTSNHSLVIAATGLLLTHGLISSCQDKPADEPVPAQIAARTAAYAAVANTNPPIVFDTARARQHIIPISVASSMTANFRSARKTLASKLYDTAYLTTNFNLANAEMFNRDAIALLLNVPNAVGIRIYNGRDNNGLIRFILVPVDGNGNDIITTLLPKTVAMKGNGNSPARVEGEAVDAGQRCPTYCPFGGPL